MVALTGNAYYRENQIVTASRGQLLLMVFDGMLRFLAEAKRAMSEKQFELQNKKIIKVQDLLLELIATLDRSVMPEMANNLERIYRYLYDQLVYANVHDDQIILDQVAVTIGELRTTWAEAEHQSRRQEPSNFVGGRV